MLSALGARHVASNVFGTDREVLWSDGSGYVLNEDIRERLTVSVEQVLQALSEQAELRDYRARAALDQVLHGARNSREIHADVHDLSVLHPVDALASHPA